jgi:SAM-dependent methyltransferase
VGNPRRGPPRPGSPQTCPGEATARAAGGPSGHDPGGAREAEHQERLRATSDQAAELYDQARPGYPPALFDDLAAVARRNLARFPAIKVVTAAFEDWPLPSEPFDLVLAATVFH